MIFQLTLNVTYISKTEIYFFSFKDTATPEIYTLSLHDALPISRKQGRETFLVPQAGEGNVSSPASGRSEEHTSELQSRFDFVCRLLLEKQKRHPSLHRPTRRRTKYIEKRTTLTRT